MNAKNESQDLSSKNAPKHFSGYAQVQGQSHSPDGRTVTSKVRWSCDFASTPPDCLQEGKWSSTSPAEAVEEFKAARK